MKHKKYSSELKGELSSRYVAQVLVASRQARRMVLLRTCSIAGFEKRNPVQVKLSLVQEVRR